MMSVLTLVELNRLKSLAEGDCSSVLFLMAARVDQRSRNRDLVDRAFIWLFCWPLIVAHRVVGDRGSE